MTSGATRPAPVIVATVAEPVATRIRPAASQASRMGEMLRLQGELADGIADAGVDQHLLEAAAAADDQDDRGDRRQALVDEFQHAPPIEAPA